MKTKSKTDKFLAASMIIAAIYVLFALEAFGDVTYYSFIRYSIAGIVWSVLDTASALFAAVTVLILGLCRVKGSGNSKHLMLAVFFASFFRVTVLAFIYALGLYSSPLRMFYATVFAITAFLILDLMIFAAGDVLIGCDFTKKKECMREFHENYRKETHALWDHIMDMRKRLKGNAEY